MGMALHFYNALFKRMQPQEGDPCYIAMGKKAASARLTASFPRAANSSILACATALDPRQKYKSFRRSFTTLADNSQSQSQVEAVWQTYYKPTTSSTPPPSSKCDFDGYFSDDEAQVLDELSSYIAFPYPRKSNDISSTEVIQFWKTHSQIYPNLSRMARKYLAIPITSVSSERLFSAARLAIPHTRCSLLPETIREEMLLKSWLKLLGAH